MCDKERKLEIVILSPYARIIEKDWYESSRSEGTETSIEEKKKEREREKKKQEREERAKLKRGNGGR